MKHIAALLLMVAGLWPELTHAQASCSLIAPGNTLVNFGSYSSLAGDVDGMGQLQILCVPDLLSGPSVSYTMALDGGSGSSGTFDPRRLVSGAGALDYNVYVDPSRSQVFGDGSVGTRTVSGACVATCTVLVYGRIFGGQPVPPGIYRDVVVVTLEF